MTKKKNLMPGHVLNTHPKLEEKGKKKSPRNPEAPQTTKRCQQKNSMESYPELDTGSRAENFNGAENVSTQCRQRGVQEEKLLGFQLTASPSPPFYKQFRHGYIVAVHKK
ncbi:hypothetical protein OUZ56_002361 [Daphnia magna]|uniref:Uncharacterized protein n=1 Tax=Daphnia magna TaxID=35525 RepID=A0ABR0A5F4_9CRUS|nr:hypothetical protein OUZ56_002361 [Daphnia magna]